MNKQCIFFILIFFSAHPSNYWLKSNSSTSCVRTSWQPRKNIDYQINAQQTIKWVNARNQDRNVLTHQVNSFQAVQNFCQKQLHKRSFLNLEDYQHIFGARYHPQFSQQNLNQVAFHSFDHYRNYAFQAYVGKLPGFEDFAKKVTSQPSLLNHLEPLLKQDILFFCKQELQRIEGKRKNKCTQQQKVQDLKKKAIQHITQRQEKIAKKRQFVEQKKQVRQLYNYYSHLLDHEPLSHQQEKRYLKRVHAIAHVLKNDGKKEIHTFNLTQISKDELKNANIEIDKFIKFCGNNAQIELHEECIAIIEQAAQQSYRLKPFPNIGELNNSAYIFANITNDYNHVEKLDEAYKVADLAWALADYSYALLQGVGDGIVNIANQVTHPIQTTKEIVESLGKIGVALADVLSDVCDITGSLIFYPEHAHDKINEIEGNIEALYSSVKKKWDETSGRDRVRKGAQLATEWYLPTKCLKLILPICSRGSQQIRDWSKKATQSVRIALQDQPLAYCAGTEAHICNDTTKNLLAKMEGVGQKSGNLTKKTQKKFQAPLSREKILPKMKSYEQARNKALEIIGDVDRPTGQPHIGKIDIFKGKIVGRKWHDGKVTLRLDYDPVKGPHINATDFRSGKGNYGKTIAIPFEGTKKTVEALLKHLQ